MEVFQLLHQEDLTPWDVAEKVVRRIGQAAQVDWSCLAIQMGDEMHFRPMHRKPDLKGFLAQEHYPPIPRTTSLVWEAADSGQAIYVDDIRSHPKALRPFVEEGIVSVAVVPLHRVLCGQKLVFSANRKQGRPWTVQDRNLFETALMAVDIAMERRQHVLSLQQAALTDPLTSLGNRRAFEADMQREFARAQRHGEPLALMVLDLDGLKGINDRFGHEEGDRLLRCFAGRLQGCMRNSDRCYRLGGDEFAVILTHCPQESGKVMEGRMGEVMREVHQEGFCGVRVSFGLAFFPDDGEAWGDLFRLADGRMYGMKGGDRRGS